MLSRLVTSTSGWAMSSDRGLQVVFDLHLPPLVSGFTSFGSVGSFDAPTFICLVVIRLRVNRRLSRWAQFCKSRNLSDVRICGVLRRMNKSSNPMNTIVKPFRRGYELLVASGNLLQSPLLLLLRVYFFWQLFMTGQGHLAHIGKVSEFFVSLGIPFPTLNAYLSSFVEFFGSLLLMIGLASRFTAIPVVVTMAVAYLTADLEAITSIFSDPDKFVKADPFPYFICALIVLVFGPGGFSIDALIKRILGQPRRSGTESRKCGFRPEAPRRFAAKS